MASCWDKYSYIECIVQFYVFPPLHIGLLHIIIHIRKVLQRYPIFVILIQSCFTGFLSFFLLFAQTVEPLRQICASTKQGQYQLQTAAATSRERAEELLLDGQVVMIRRALLGATGKHNCTIIATVESLISGFVWTAGARSSFSKCLHLHLSPHVPSHVE